MTDRVMEYAFKWPMQIAALSVKLGELDAAPDRPHSQPAIARVERESI